MHSIKLNVNPYGWRVFLKRKQDPAFKAFSEKVFQRDNNTCQFCGFYLTAYQEVINLDQDYTHNKFSNLVTACGFCAQCFFLQTVGTENYGGGSLVYLPELDQAHLNRFCHILFIEINAGSEFKENAQDAYRSFKLRSEVIEKEFGDGMSEPSVFGKILIELDSGEINTTLFEPIRLLPSRAGFQGQIEKWGAMQ
jgi:intracellular multiplication protein IcmJ